VGRLAVVFLVTAFLLSFGSIALPAHAADDSNAGQLTPVPTVTPQQLSSALSTLGQGTNSTQMQQLLSQFQSELNSGNYNGAASTLVQLQDLSNSNPGSASPALNALLQSLSVGSNGASVNANTLASLLSAASSSGSGTSAGSAQTLSVDMASLASLMQYANSTMASELLQNSSLLSQSAFSGSGAPVASSPIALPGLSGFSHLSVPSIGTPSLSIGSPSGGLPDIPLTAFIVPLVAAAGIAAIFLSRGRIARIVGTQSLPGMTFLRGSATEEVGPVPSDPRAKIEFYFHKAVRLMARRGVTKLESETHREFSSKCEEAPERPQVATISSLYEKAKFSGQDVGGTDATLAAASFAAMEEKR